MFPFSYSGQKLTDIIPTMVSALVVVYIEITDRSSFTRVQKLEWQKVTRPQISNKIKPLGLMENESKPFEYTDKHHNFIMELVKMPPRHVLKVEIQPELWSQLVEGNL